MERGIKYHKKASTTFYLELLIFSLRKHLAKKSLFFSLVELIIKSAQCINQTWFRHSQCFLRSLFCCGHAKLISELLTRQFLLKRISIAVFFSDLQPVQPCSSDKHESLTSNKGRFTSPYFPKYFQEATQCDWLIKVAPGYVVTLEFSKFEVGHEAECSNRESRTNFVEVRDGMKQKNRTIGMFCGSRKPDAISSTGNQMWIRYVTSGYRSTKFEARYSATKGMVQIIM